MTTRPAPSARNRSAAGARLLRACGRRPTAAPAARPRRAASWRGFLHLQAGDSCRAMARGAGQDSARRRARRTADAPTPLVRPAVGAPAPARRLAGGPGAVQDARWIGPPARARRRQGTAAVAPGRTCRAVDSRRRPRRAPARRRVSRCVTCSTAAAKGCWRGPSTASRGVAIWAFIVLHVARHLARRRPTRTLYDEVLALYASPIGRIGEMLLGAGAAVPRAQRPADHHHRLLAGDDRLPQAAVVAGLGGLLRRRASRAPTSSSAAASGTGRRA